MASESKRKTNKQSTITFTLPLSCQICLGKVKQPVLCPNHHVFCQLCMDIWLEKNKQCPTCRVEINDNNPVKNIIGGQLEDEDVRKQSCAELRRARFELLYKEYEDQFDQMRKESIILRTENNILLAQLQDAEEKEDAQNNAEKDAKGSSSGKNEPNLLMLTKNLQEAQTLYAGIKEEMKQLKQENSKLKDENVNLTRENENLRLEIAQRSPKKFGRYTVATLETKLSEYEKEIRQLKKALERSDEYVEDLEKQIEKLSSSRHEQYDQKLSRIKKTSTSGEIPHSEKNGHAYLNGTGPSNSDLNEDNKLLQPSSLKESSLSQDRESARRILFSLCAETGNKSSHRSGSGDSQTRVERGEGNGEEMEHVVKYPESIMKHGGGGEGSQKQCNGNPHELNGKMSMTKKVQFNIPKSANSSASFELEMPSPYGNNRQSLPNQSENYKDDNVDEVDGSVPSTDFDTHVVSLLKKANASNYNNSHSSASNHNGHIPGIKLTSSGDLISKHETTARTAIPKKTGTNHHYEDSNDSSRLSLPDFDSPQKLASLDSDGSVNSPRKSKDRDGLAELDDTDDKTYEKLADRAELDISMTPEMTDCLRLLNQAELKLEMPSSSNYPDRGTNPPSAPKSNPASFQVASSHSTNSKVPSLPYNSSFKPQSFSSSESMKGWEQEFFRGLHANPYKPYKFNNPPSSIHSVTSDNSNDLHVKLAQKKPNSPLPQNTPLINNNTPALSPYPTNQNPFSSATSSNLPYSSSSNKYGGGSNPNSNSNPLASHFEKLQSFTSSIPISLSSSDHPYQAGGSSSNSNPLDRYPSGSIRAPTPPPSSSSLASHLFSLSKNPSNHLSSSSTKDLHNGLYSSSHSFNPSSGSSHANFRNPLPPSLNNSSLEWPDSPVRNFTSSDHNGIASSSSSRDFLTESTSFRDRNRFASLAGSSSPRNLQSRSNHDLMFTSANSSFSSDVNNSSYLPEPKKRLFNLDDELDLPTSKTAKK